MRIVLDTNILIRAGAKDRGPARELLETFTASPRHTLVVMKPLPISRSAAASSQFQLTPPQRTPLNLFKKTGHAPTAAIDPMSGGQFSQIEFAWSGRVRAESTGDSVKAAARVDLQRKK
jgi:hypothetical protein